MAAQLRVLRRRIRSVQSTKKITRAQELIATARIGKAQQRLDAARPYAFKLLDALENLVASAPRLDHPLLTEPDNPRRAAVILVTSDRGFAGAYSANAIRQGEKLHRLLRERGLEPVPFVVGRKGVSFYRFRGREVAGEWTGFSENPTYDHAADIGAAVLEALLRDSDEGGVDEIHIAYTHFHTMVRQEARARRLLPLVVEDETPEEVSPFYTPTRAETAPRAFRPEGSEGTVQPLLSFEPSAEEVLDALLPKYLNVLVFALLLNSAASELAARRRAMKSATDNAEDLVRALTIEANAARQAEITNEISEIVGGADALASASAGAE